MPDKAPPRRLAFDEITAGWGADNREDLQARIKLAKEFLEIKGMSSFAENKMLRAMEARYIGFKIAAGEMEPAK